MSEYPSDEFLDYVRTYNTFRNGPCELIERIWDEWHYPDYIRWYPKTKTLKISTGGWSGHEEIISALQENFAFWSLYWRATLRGGHYTFKIVEVKHDKP